MNINRVNALADLIESLPHTDYRAAHGFSMSCYVHACNTPSCMAGWAAWEHRGRPEELSLPEVTWDALQFKPIIADALAFLEISEEQEKIVKDELFLGDYSFKESAFITPARAARTLRHFATSGVVDWTI